MQSKGPGLQSPRILLYAGKGGVGKTCVAAATGILCAEAGLNTLVMSLDPAHSLGDAFDLERGLLDQNRGQPVAAAERLWVQELDVYEEIGRHWSEVHRYLSLLLHTSGIEGILAEELAILPGMEELSALLYINRYVQERSFEVIVLDCAPTAESVRFVSMPTALEWYMKKVFRLERRIFNYVRPVAKRWVEVPLPEDDYFANIDRLYQRLQGIDRLLSDPAVTSVRLVTNPEKMVLRETQRAFMYFSLHRLSIDAVIMNRVLPAADDDAPLKAWAESQRGYTELARRLFSPLPLLIAPLYQGEVVGYEPLRHLGLELYRGRRPWQPFSRRRPCEFVSENGRNLIKLHLPFAGKEEVDVAKVGDELVIKIGNFRKNMVLPRTLAQQQPRRAQLQHGYLWVEFQEEEDEPEQKGKRGTGRKR